MHRRTHALAGVVLMFATVLAACSSSHSTTGAGSTDATPSTTTAATGTTALADAPITVRTVPVPSGVAPSLPVFTEDGHHVLFVYTKHGVQGSQLATIGTDGTGFACITCALRPAVDVSKPFLSRDGTRVLVRTPSGKGNPTTIYHYDIIDCAHGVLACPAPVMRPLDLPGKDAGVVQSRELRLSPDGQHIAFSQVRPGGWTLVLGTLHRSGARYELTDLRLLAPAFHLGDAATGWAAAGAFYEVKSFADDGRTIVYATTYGSSLNYDDYALDLVTGKRRRLTAEPDWDEPLDISPDGTTYVVGSSRGTHRLDGLSLVPRPPFFDFASYAQVARWLLTTNARDCIVRPWLLDAAKPDTTQPGRELDGQAWAEGYAPRAIASWSPDGTRVVMWDELLRPEAAGPGAAPSRLRIVTLTDRAPAPAHPARPTPVPAWAWRYDQYPLTGRTAHVTVHGAGGGTAVLDFTGDFLRGAYTARYDHFDAGNGIVLDGIETFVNRSIVSDGSYSVDLTASGAHRGAMHGRFTIAGTKLTGSVTSTLDGVQTSWPPPPCPPPSTTH